MSSDAHKAGRLAADKAREAGASVIDIDLPPAFREALEAQSVIQNYEACRSLAFELRFRGEDVSRALKDYVAAGYDTTRERYDWARNVQAVCRAAMWQVFSQIGAIITPAAPGVRPKTQATRAPPSAIRSGPWLARRCERTRHDWRRCHADWHAGDRAARSRRRNACPCRLAAYGADEEVRTAFPCLI